LDNKVFDIIDAWCNHGHSVSHLHILAAFCIYCNSHKISELRIENMSIYEMPMKLFPSGGSLETHSEVTFQI